MSASNGAQKRSREEGLIHSPEEKKVRYDYDDLLLDDILEESDPDPPVEDLDSVIKSLEEEISNPLEVGSGLVSQPEFGYLLEASDDELGLPPSKAADGERVEVTDLLELGENWGFEDERDFGFVDGGEYLTLDSDDLFDSGSTEFSWRSESV